jgi:hypothetical protein
MKALALAFCGAACGAVPCTATSLKEAYDLAGPAAGYARYLVLETGVTYSGGLWIGQTFNRVTAEFEGKGADVRIVGNGAILDLQGQEICIAYCTNRFDIDDCVILHGDLKFRGYDGGDLNLIPKGSVRHVTFYEPHDYGIRMFRAGAGVLLERNLVVDAVDTGWDFMFLSGIPSSWLPTGASFALSLQGGWNVRENWSFHTDPAANADLARHFSMLCDYG